MQRKEADNISGNRLIDILTGAKTGKTVMAGFDGYVDSILRVRKSQGSGGDSFFTSLKEFGEYTAQRAGKSGSLELKLITEKLGGNMPIFSAALSEIGQRVSCIGAVGYPRVLPMFANIGHKIVSVCAPGTCEALEFDDGKLMLARNEDIEAMDFELLKRRAGLETLVSLADEADVITFLNWSELKGSTSVWRGYINEVFPRLSGEKKKMFVDISDCSHRAKEDITEMADLLCEFAKITELSVSLNQNEAECVARALETDVKSIEGIAQELYERLKCNKLIIHLTDSSLCVYEGRLIQKENRFIEKPLISTGGGDNFNAGFVYGLILDLDPLECMTVANGFSSYYVSHGRSPKINELIEWLCEEINEESERMAM